MSDQPDTNTVVSVERDGRILSGAGADADTLHEVMDRHAPPDKAAPDPSPAPAASSADPSVAPPAPSQVKPTRGQARFSELTEQRKQAETRAEAAERERDELKARLSQQAAPQAEPRREPQQQPPVSPPQYTRPEPSEDEVGDKYPTYAAFTRDQALWVLEQQQQQFDQRMRQAIEWDRSQRAYQDQVKATQDKGRELYADFDQVLASGPGGQIQMPVEKIQAIYAAPNSPSLQYTIMKDAALAQRLAQMSPIAFGLELAKLSGSTPQPGNSKPAPAVSQAPAPFQPVGTGSKSTVPSSGELAGKTYDFDASGYRAKRAAERGVKPRPFGR